MTASTAPPARTIIMILRGEESPSTSASSVSAPVMPLSSGSGSTNARVFSVERL